VAAGVSAPAAFFVLNARYQGFIISRTISSLGLIPRLSNPISHIILIEMPHHNRTGKKNQQRSDLTGEHRSGDRWQIIFVCLFAAIWVSDSFFLNYSTFPTQYMLLGVRLPIGITLLSLAGYLAVKGLHIVFGENRRKPSVIQKNVFNVVRHPIYLAEILVYLGLLVLNMSLAALGIWITTIIFLHHISRYEEELLVKRFGAEYQQYMRRVPMWIPRIRRR
jgi:protein-S-isoprenylcysteine O-methyltransferase Ste14